MFAEKCCVLCSTFWRGCVYDLFNQKNHQNMLFVKGCPNCIFYHPCLDKWSEPQQLNFKRGFLLVQRSDIVVALHNNTNNQKGMTWTEGNCKSLTTFQLLSNKSDIV